MSFSFRIYALLALVVLLSSCSSKKSDPGERHFLDSIFGEDAYEKVFEKNTQTKTTSSDLDVVLKADVTFWNDNLREAYVEEVSRRYRLPDEESSALALEQLAEEEAYFVFIVTATTRYQADNNFDQRDSLWRISLEDRDTKKSISAHRVELVSYKNQRARYFYKTMTRFGETYRVLFSKDELRDARNLRLYISGPKGSIDFDFEQVRRSRARELIEAQ